ncbi:MFS transporter [Knoellia locipacati]|uniref:MFS transporter n=1 Tax=Knoellia locipacati TaxID=882824 RepID=A0A512SXM2_9MICO|nr:MFS transporter [Knoellia locipacati]GEQ12664.1 MFS transporter [Knoellia locipacati]
MTRPLRRQIHDIGRRRAWVIWAVALSVYVVAVFHRTSLGVAGLVAAERFHITASQLATFTVVQLVVYAGMQIPVGVLLDRFGSRRLLLVGLALISVGQLWFAFAGSFGVGLAARVLLGMGDAMIFTSMLRLVALWFRVKQAPVITQVSGMVGQLGAVAAATPLAAALTRFGWERSFGISAGVGALLSVGLFLVVKDSPYTGMAVEKIKVRALARTLAEVWGNPGTRLGMWIHFTGQFGATVFTMLWGYPFLVQGQGLSASTAGALLITLTLSAMVAGPVVGHLTGRLPYRRSQIVLTIVAAIAATWALVLLWPGRAPLPLLVLLVCVTGCGGPGSMVGFDLARSFHPSDRLGRASGVINIGGFFASLVTMALVGLILDARAPEGPGSYTLTDFKVAMSVQFLLWGLGAFQIWRYRYKGLEFVDEHPGALDALRSGETLLPGISRDPD